MTHITLCTVTYHHVCNMVMVDAILFAASLSLCYTATYYGTDQCIGSCWCMGDSKYKDSTLHIKAEGTQITVEAAFAGLLLSWGLQHNGICINRFWLVGGKAIILIGFHFCTCILIANHRLWMPINTQTKDFTASTRSAWVAPISPNTLFES